MLGIPFGLVYANAAEWLIHREVLHGVGKKKSSFWNFHWGEHHRNCRKQRFYDPDYARSPFADNAQGKEALAVVGLMLAHAPLFGVAPWFTATVWYAGFNYLYTHRKAHLDPSWAKEHLRHHYDHHMGKNQDANWCVTHPFMDWVMGTRVEYEYDEKERSKEVRSAPRKTARAGAGASVANNSQSRSDDSDEDAA